MIYLIDGTYELYRAFFGPPAAQVHGREVGAARGLLRSLAAWLRTERPTHVAIAFDHVIESFRNDLFAGYKTGDGVEPDLFAQFSLAEDVARALGLCTWPMVEFEADDALATAAKAHERSAVRICSPDKDLAQCVRGDRVVLWDRWKQAALDEAGVSQKFGVRPAQIADYLALVGDTADGIPGLRGWGAKSAAQVLSHYGSLASIPRDTAWNVAVRGADKLRATLAAEWDAVQLYRRLATLRTDVPVDTSRDALVWRGPSDSLLAICDTVGVAPPSLQLS